MIREWIEEIVKDVVQVYFHEHRRMRHTDLFCEVCGCSLVKFVKGEPVIKENNITDFDGKTIFTRGHYIYYPHYCLVHAPKKDDNEESQS